MESIISKLSSIENEANSILEQATYEKEQLSIQLEKDMSALENKYLENTESKLTKIQQEYNQKYDDSMSSIRNKTTKEIAKVLNISEKTVRNHISNAMQKLGVKGRAQAVVELLRMNIISL